MGLGVQAFSAFGAADETEASVPGAAETMRTKQVEMARVLLEAGASPNAADARKRSCLMMASASGNTELVQVLLQAEAVAVDAADEDGTTALMVASQRGHVDAEGEVLLVGRGRLVPRLAPVRRALHPPHITLFPPRKHTVRAHKPHVREDQQHKPCMLVT